MIVTSRKRKDPTKHQQLTVVATAVGLFGYVCQFLGLRFLSHFVTIAQVVLTALMVALRAWVRRPMAHEPEYKHITGGYEVECTAMDIKGCDDWILVSPSTTTAKISIGTPATEVMEARCQLGGLSQWSNPWKKETTILAEAIETAMNFVFSNGDIRFRKPQLIHRKFTWKILVQVKERGGKSSYQEVSLALERVVLEGGGWSPWKVSRDGNTIEVVVGLGCSISNEISRIWTLPEKLLTKHEA